MVSSKAGADTASSQKPSQEALAAHYAGVSRDGEFVSKCEMQIPPALEGATVLDIGCRRGKGVYKISSMVGPKGTAIGLDWSADFLDDAKAHEEENWKREGFAQSNMKFVQGYPEDLETAGIEDDSIDVVLMNSALNLSMDIEQVLRQIRRVLKPGGEMYLMTVLADRRFSKEVYDKALAAGDSIGTAPYLTDFRHLLDEVGFHGFVFVSMDQVKTAESPVANELISANVAEGPCRAFKLDNMEYGEEDYGQNAEYDGKIPGCEKRFSISRTMGLVPGFNMPVSNNTYRILSETRYAPYFKLDPGKGEHLGVLRLGRRRPEGR